MKTRERARWARPGILLSALFVACGDRYEGAAVDDADAGIRDAGTSVQNLDAAGLGDAATDGNVCSGSECDCDDDGFISASCAAAEAAEAGTTDCDDTDPLSKPGQDFRDIVPPVGRAGDWNCDGVVEKAHSVRVRCEALHSCAGGGFTDEPGCGDEGTFVRCDSDTGLSGCVPVEMGVRKQSCK